MSTPPTGQIWRSYYFAGSQRVAMRETTSSSDTVYYFVADHPKRSEGGSTSVTLDASGNKIGEMKYYAVPRSAAEWVSLWCAVLYLGQHAHRLPLHTLAGHRPANAPRTA